MELWGPFHFMVVFGQVKPFDPPERVGINSKPLRNEIMP